MIDKDSHSLKSISHKYYLNGTNSCVVGVFIDNKFEHYVQKINKDRERKYIQLLLTCGLIKINLFYFLKWLSE